MVWDRKIPVIWNTIIHFSSYYNEHVTESIFLFYRWLVLEGSIEIIIDRLKNPEGLPEGLDWRIRPWPEGFFNLSIIILMDPHSNWRENFAKMAEIPSNLQCMKARNKAFSPSSMDYQSIEVGEFNGLENLMTILHSKIHLN